MPAKCTFSFWEGGIILVLIPPSHRRVFKNKFYGWARCFYLFLPRFNVIYRNKFFCVVEIFFTFFSLA